MTRKSSGKKDFPSVSNHCPADGVRRMLQGRVFRHCLPERVCLLGEHLNIMQLTVSGEYSEVVFRESRHGLLDMLKKHVRELRNIYHHHPESKKKKSSEGNSGSIHAYGRYGNPGKTSQTICTIAILWPVNAIFETVAAVEVDTFISLHMDFSRNDARKSSFSQTHTHTNSIPFWETDFYHYWC